MGQKIHPKGLRIGIIRGWDSRWFADGEEYVELLHEDIAIRDHIKAEMFDAGISRTEIERAGGRVQLTVHTARPGMVIGRGGSGVERLQRDLEEMTDRQVSINVVEIDAPNLDAQLVAESVALQLERRISFRRAMRQAASRVMRSGAEGVRVMVAGRLGGLDMSRTEYTQDGSVPLHTLRADIDYGFAEAKTTYGVIGVKVWINKGEIIPEATGQEEEA